MKQLKAKISSKKATEILQEASTFLHKSRNIEHTELVYLPYYLYEVTVNFQNQSKIKKNIGVDCVDGEYAFINDIEIITDIENEVDIVVKINIDEAESQEIAEKAVKDIILMRMKKGIQVLNIESKLLHLINYPYWIGLYRKKSKLEFDAIDAISGKKQGVKMRPVLLKQIMQ